MAKKNNEDFSEFFDIEKEVVESNDYSDFFEMEKEVVSKKKSQSQSGSSTEESSSGTSATKKEQSSGTTKPLSLEEKKELARKQKLGQLDEKKQESVTALDKKQSATSLDKSKQDSKLALERKQKSTNINWDVDKETEQAFKGISSERKDKAIQEAMSVGENYVPNIEKKARAKEIQEAKPEQDLKRRLNLIPKEDLKSIFEGDNELTMFDGGRRLAEKYKLTEEEVEKAKAKYLEETVNEFKRKDLESSLDLIGKYAPAPKDFKDITAYTQNIELLNKAKEMNFEKNKNLSFSLMGLEDNDRKVVDEYSSVMDRLNAYKGKSFMQQQQGADETGKGSMVINPKEIAQFEKDLKESQRLSKEVDKIRGNNNKLFDQYANVINKETGKTVTQESFTSKYENDYMKLKGALTDATYKLNYLEKEARGIRDAEREGGRILTDAQLTKQNAKLGNLDKERNLAKAEVLALSNALFLNEDITKKVARYEKADSYYQMPGKKAERLFEVLGDLKQGFSETVLGEFNMTSTSEKNQARMLNEKLKSVGINLKDTDKEIAPTYPEKFGNVLGTSAVLGVNIAATSFLTGGAGTLARGAGLLPKVFAMYDKGGKFKKIADVVISGVNFELASDQTSFAMGSAEEAAQLAFNKVFGKLKALNPVVNFFTKSLVGASAVTVEEYAGDLFHEFTKTGISQETFDNTFGKTKEEGLEKWSLTFTMGMMSMGKHAKILMVGSYETAKAINPNAETVKQMEAVMSEMGVDPDDVIKELKAEAQTKSDRLYPDGKGGQLSASNMTVEQEIVLRDKLKYKPLTEDELAIKRSVQETEELAPADSPYVTKKEMDDDLKVLKGEDEGTLPETYVGESVRTEEGIVTTVTEKVEEGTQLRVPTEQLVTEEAKPVSETFDREKAGVIDVWQDPETNELFVINGTKRVATAMEDGVASVDVNFVKANSLQEAYKIGELKNKLEDTDKTLDAVELVKANPVLKDNLDLSKPKELELFGLASLNESLTEELKTDPKQAEILSIIGNSVPTEQQSEVYQFAKENNFGKDEVAQLVKEPNLLERATKKEVVKTNKALSSVDETTKALDFENTTNEQLQTVYDNLSSSNNKEAKRLSNLVENVQEKNERNSILNTALSNVKNVVDKIIKSGEYFLEKREAREAIDVAEKYSGTVEKQEAKKDFKDAFFGNPNNWVADALKMREATRTFMEQGGTFKELLQSVQKEFEFDGYSEQEAASFIKSKLESITKKDFRQKSIAEEYHKAKKDGSNPELVEAVESIFIEEQKSDVELKAKVELKTELSKTGQSNIDALSKDATQLGVEPETLYDRVLSNSPTVKALTEKYAKGVANGLYSTTEATNRLNAEIKENLGKITEEAGLGEAKKDVAQLEEALTSDKKTFAEAMRDIASKVDKLADSIKIIPNSTLKISITFGLEPAIYKAFLKGLSVTLKTSATFIDAFNKAIKKLQANAEFKKKTAQEQADIIAQLTNSITDIKQKADLKNPITKLQQSKVKQSVRDRIKHLYQTQMTSLPTLKSIEKIATNYGIIDAKTFAEKLYRDLNKLEKTRERRMETFEGAISDFITKGGGNIKSLFNKLSDLILKDKEQAVTLKNVILSALEKANTKGLKFSQQQLAQITTAFEKANLTNLSGIYDLTSKIDQIVNKAVDLKVNQDISNLQKAIKRFKNIPKKQLMVFQNLANIEANKLTNPATKTDLLNALEDIKNYLSGNSNLSYNESDLNSIIQRAETEIENYNQAKQKALIEKRFKEYKKNNPNSTLSRKEYRKMIMLTEDQRKKERELANRAIKRGQKRDDLEKLTEENIEELFDYKVDNSKTVLEKEAFEKILIPALRKLIDTGELKNLSNIQLKEINQLHAELMNFDSLSKVGFVANQMSGVLKANENKQLIKDSFREFSNDIKSLLQPSKGKYQGLTLGQAFKRIFVGSTGQKISSEIISRVNVGINLAKTEYKKFNKNFEEALKFEVSASENYDLGAKAYFLTSPKGLSDIDAQLLFENKKEKLQRDIDELKRISKSKDSSRNKKKSAEIRANQYQESLDFINKYDTYEDYVKAYNNGEVFSEKQQKVFDLAKNEYEKQKPMLIASNLLFNGNAFIEEDYYTSTSYLKNEVGAEADKSVADEVYNNLNVIRDPQSGTVFKKVNPASVGTDKILDFDFTGVTQSRVLENYYDMFTRGSVIELDALLQSESFYENFKDKNMTETYSYLYQRIANWINNETSVQQSKLDNSRSASKKVTDVLSNIKKAILNTTGQVVKQPTVLFHTLSRFGFKDFSQGLSFYANNLATEAGRDKIRMLLDGSDVRNRAPLGDEQIAQSLNRQKSFALTDSNAYRFLQKLYSEPLKMIPGLKDSKVASAVSLQKALNIGDAAMVYSDIMAAQLTYITAMINQQKKDGYDVNSIDDLILNKTEKNTHISDMLSAEINNESATSKQGNLFSGKDNKILANLFFMFQSHASNASHAASNALLDMFETNKNVTIEDRFNSVKAIVGFTSAIITFRAMSEIVKLLYAQIYETAADEIGYEDPRDEEEKDRLKLLKDQKFLEEASYRIGINAFTDIFFGGKFPSPVKDLTVFGTNTLFENLHLKYVDEEYEGRLPYSNNPMEYSGVIGAGLDFITDANKIISPPLDNVERDDILRDMAMETLLRQQWESYKNDKQGAFIDGLYTMFKLTGKGEPAKMMQMLQKQRERGFKEEDEKRTGVFDLFFEKRK